MMTDNTVSGVPVPLDSEKGRASRETAILVGNDMFSRRNRRPIVSSKDPDHCDRLADVRILASVSIVIPIYKEATNTRALLDQIDKMRREYAVDLEVLFMDDESNDGSVEEVEDSGYEWARIIVRNGCRGLSPAVVDGLKLSKNQVIVVMDGDMSHPPAAIPRMILALDGGQDFVIGSRYTAGGSTDSKWGVLRWLNSKVATMLARPLTCARDPMSGFFALRQSTYKKAPFLNPVGFKIGLELIVKCAIERISEIPIHFCDRRSGKSKLNFAEQLRYIQHLRRLYIYKFAYASSLLQFLVVGSSGVVVNLCILTMLVWIGSPNSIAVLGGILVSVTTNFLLNRRFTFSYAMEGSIVRQFVGFCSAAGAAMMVNYTVTMLLSVRIPELPIQVAALIGIAAGTLLNYSVNQFVIFNRRVSR